jgi:macrolide transport system ATP-binding/permease protein
MNMTCMTLLTVHGLKKDLGGVPILTEITFHLAHGERVGLVGANGAGKSTVMQILAGLLPPDEGIVHWMQRGLKTAYMPQEPAWAPDRPLGEQMMGRDLAAGGLAPSALALLKRCGLTADHLARPVGALSGGEKTRALLWQALAPNPAVLLLDEPTNHLDMAGTDWLIDLLCAWDGTLLVVSHDRHFLDRVTERTLELSDGRIRSFTGNWSAYRDQKRAERERQEAEYRQYLVKKRQLEAAIQRERQWAISAHTAKVDPTAHKFQAGFQNRQAGAHMRIAQSMAKRLERIRVAKPRDAAQVNVRFGGGADTARHLLLAQGLGFAYPGGRPLFTGADFWIERGDRVAIVGPNGAGKSTLIRLILGELQPTEGRLHRAPVTVGYLHQEMADLHPNLTVLQEALSAGKMGVAATRNLLGALLFRGEAIQKKVGDLSGGERLRLALTKLILQEPDLLILDEPTNGLDLLTRERVEEALEAYQGSLLLVSHDRYLLERLTTCVLAVGEGRIRAVRKGFRAWAARQREGLAQGARTGGAVQPKAAPSARERQEAILLLETRLAALGARLSAPAPAEKAALEAEFLALSRELRTLKHMG